MRLAVNDDRYEAYGIEFEALLQGVILIETQWYRSWLPQRFPLVYVEYLASAPWNVNYSKIRPIWLESDGHSCFLPASAVWNC